MLDVGLLYLDPNSKGEFDVYDPDNKETRFKIKAPEGLGECRTFLTGVNQTLEVIEEDDE